MARGPPRPGLVSPSQVGSQPAMDEIAKTWGGWRISRARSPAAGCAGAGPACACLAGEGACSCPGSPNLPSSSDCPNLAPGPMAAWVLS